MAVDSRWSNWSSIKRSILLTIMCSNDTTFCEFFWLILVEFTFIWASIWIGITQTARLRSSQWLCHWITSESWQHGWREVGLNIKTTLNVVLDFSFCHVKSYTGPERECVCVCVCVCVGGWVWVWVWVCVRVCECVYACVRVYLPHPTAAVW